MKHFIDGDQVVVTRDDFIDLQSSDAVFIPQSSTLGKTILRTGIISIPFGDLRAIKNLLDCGGGSYHSPINVCYNHITKQGGPK